MTSYQRPRVGALGIDRARMAGRAAGRGARATGARAGADDSCNGRAPDAAIPPVRFATSKFGALPDASKEFPYSNALNVVDSVVKTSVNVILIPNFVFWSAIANAGTIKSVDVPK